MNSNSRKVVRYMCTNAIIGALYYVLVIVCGDLSFGFINGIISIRIAEVLMALCIFDIKLAPGLVVGCLLANLFPITTSSNIIDVLVGPLQSALTALLLYYVKPRQLSILLGTLLCGVVIGLEIYLLGFSVIGLWVIATTFVSEYIIVELGYLFFKKFYQTFKFI